MPFAYSNNGMTMRAIERGMEEPYEIVFDDIATEEQLRAMFQGYGAAESKRLALLRLDELENSITPRRIREAILGIDGGWLDGVNSQIATIRSQL